MTDLGAAEPGGSGTEPAPKDDFGTHLQDFYIALRGGDPYVLSDAMGSLEHVAANERTRVGLDCSETLAMQDVVLDCQKKCAQALRSRVADNVSTLLAASRKKLRAKISKDMESSTLHNQRHINSMLELFGDWSDMVAGIVNGGLSDKVKSLVIVPFHVRVMEVSFECFEQFKSDKNISNWLKRVSDPLEQMNLISLDLILVQLAGMRELTMQYQSFLIDTCGLVDLSLAEFDSWKELDIVYCALDYAYIGLAISEAVADSKKSLLLCVEDNRPVYVLQGVEDAFFVIRKVVDRAISTGSDMILFSVINRVMELLGHDRDSLGKSGNSSVTLLQTIVSMRPYYRAILRLMKQSKREAVLEKGPIPVASKADSNNDEALEMTEAMINSGTDAALSVGMGLANVLVSAVSSYSVGEGSSNSSSAMDSTVSTVSSLVGAANSWLMGFSEIAAPLPDPLPAVACGSKTVKQSPPPSWGSGVSNYSSQSTVLKAENCVELYEEELINEEDIQLSIEDAIVRLNTIGIARVSVEGLRTTFGGPAAMLSRNDSIVYENNDSPSGVIRSELSRCHGKLCEYGLSASLDLAAFLYEHFMLPPLRSALLYDRVQVDLDTVSFFDSVEDASCKARNYDVNAAQYDHLSSERRLRRAISCFFDKSAAFADFDISDKGYVSTIGGKRITCGGDGAASCSDSRDRPWTESRLYSEMTSLVFSEIVGHIASCTAQYLEVQLFKLQYSEWGAMLMQQEVMSIIQCFEKSVEGCAVDWANTFRKLKGLLKILTLQQPADILRYTSNGLLPADVAEDDIRRVMKLRVDFSKEVLERIKIIMPLSAVVVST